MAVLGVLQPVQWVRVVRDSIVPSDTAGLTIACQVTTRVSPAGKLSIGIPIGTRVRAVVSGVVSERVILSPPNAETWALAGRRRKLNTVSLSCAAT